MMQKLYIDTLFDKKVPGFVKFRYSLNQDSHPMQENISLAGVETLPTCCKAYSTFCNLFLLIEMYRKLIEKDAAEIKRFVDDASTLDKGV